MKKYILPLTILFLLFTVNVYAAVVNPVNNYSVYQLDSGVTDHGAATAEGNRSVKDWVDWASGTTKIKLIARNNNTSGTTQYTSYYFQTTESIGSNIIVEFEPGAMFDVLSGITVTFNSPENIFAGKRQQIMTGSGDLAFVYGGTVYPDWAGENTTPGTTSMVNAVNAVERWLPSIDAFNQGGQVYFSGTTYVLNNWNPKDGVRYTGSSTSSTILLGTTSHIINIGATRANGWRYFVVENLTMVPYNSGSYACVYTAPSGNNINNGVFRDVRFDAPGKYGCYGYFNLVTWDHCWFGNTDSTEKLVTGLYFGGIGSACHQNIVKDSKFYYCSSYPVNIQGIAGTYAQHNVFQNNTFEQCDDIAFMLNYAWGTKILHNYFETLNKVSGSYNSIFYLDNLCLGMTNIDYNHFVGSLGYTTSIIKCKAAQNPYITCNWNEFSTAYNNICIINDLQISDRFWYLGDYSSGVTFGADGTYDYFSDAKLLNKKLINPGNASYASDRTIYANGMRNALITNIGQLAGAGVNLTWTLDTAAEGYDFDVMIAAGGLTTYIKAGASDKFYLDGLALDDGNKVGILSGTTGDTFHIWSWEAESGSYDWWIHPISGATCIDSGP